MKALCNRLHEESEPDGETASERRAPGQAKQDPQKDAFPMQYAMTQNNLGNAYRTLAEVEEKAKNCRAAIDAYEEALKISFLHKLTEVAAAVARNLQVVRRFCASDE